MAKKKATANKPRTKTEIFSDLADKTGLTKKQVSAVFDEIQAQIKKDLSPRGPGAYNFPGLMKVYIHTRPAQKARKNVKMPDGSVRDIAAKKARKVVKVRPLKTLKDMA